jgi:pimeloyl-ACP methyl ester carboxylesterase
MAIHTVYRLTLAAALAGAVQAPPATPPAQPASGPGGRSYLHQEVRTTRLGAGAREVHLFEPATPTPPQAPVVIFGHGWSAVNPALYGGWIAHIVRRGYTVIHPRYQLDPRTPVAQFTEHALAATKQALETLRGPGHVPPDPRGIALAGHSMGGLVATNLAVRAARGELPPPLALMVVAPGKTWPESSRIAFPLEDVSQLPSNLLLLAVVGDDDDFVREFDARKIFKGATAVAAANKNYVRVFSDDHGSPALVADHRFASAPLTEEGPGLGPLAASDALASLAQGPAGRSRTQPVSADLTAGRGPWTTDALDYFGTWKLLDGLVDAVFRGVHREYALGDTFEQRYMGEWSDRVPVRILSVERP